MLFYFKKDDYIIKIKSLDIIINKTPYDESITGTRDEENEF